MKDIKLERSILTILSDYYQVNELPVLSERDMMVYEKMMTDFREYGRAFVHINFIQGAFLDIVKAIQEDNLPEHMDRVNVLFIKRFANVPSWSSAAKEAA